MELRDYLTLSTDTLFDHFGKGDADPLTRHVLLEGSDDVLFVAHLDHVGEYNGKWDVGIWGDYVVSIALDDRLGVYLALEKFREWGMHPDVLLTDREEVGDSTARYFQPTRDYNWMFSLDRAGDDVVLYQYGDATLEGMLRDGGFKIGRGSYSDIADLGDLGIKGINWGIDYHLQHTDACYAHLGNVRDRMEVIASWYEDYKDTPLPHDDYYYHLTECILCYAPGDLLYNGDLICFDCALTIF